MHVRYQELTDTTTEQISWKIFLMDFYGYQKTLHCILDELALTRKLAKIKKY